MPFASRVNLRDFYYSFLLLDYFYDQIIRLLLFSPRRWFRDFNARVNLLLVSPRNDTYAGNQSFVDLICGLVNQNSFTEWLYLKLSALYVQTEVIHDGIANCRQNRVERETLHLKIKRFSSICQIFKCSTFALFHHARYAWMKVLTILLVFNTE